MLTVNNLRPV